MKSIRCFCLFLCTVLPALAAPSAPGWTDALRAMPLPAGAPPLNRDNAVAVLLQAFRSNATIKAMVVLPGVSDDFYLIHRDAPPLNLRATTLGDALAALTNATPVRLTWREPFLFVHVEGDRLEPAVQATDDETARRLRQEVALSGGTFVDRHWEKLQPQLTAGLRVPVQPAPASEDAWHFERHNFAAWNLTGWELLQVLSLTGNTRVTVQKQAVHVREWNRR